MKLGSCSGGVENNGGSGGAFGSSVSSPLFTSSGCGLAKSMSAALLRISREPLRRSSMRFRAMLRSSARSLAENEAKSQDRTSRDNIDLGPQTFCDVSHTYGLYSA